MLCVLYASDFLCLIKEPDDISSLLFSPTQVGIFCAQINPLTLCCLYIMSAGYQCLMENPS